MLETRPVASARYDSLDAWRGIACLMVVVYHAGLFGIENNIAALRSFGGLLLYATTTLHHGVTLFFVISGYCIAAAVEASMRRRGSIVDFFRRRVRRIFPPFWVMVALTALGVGLVHANGGGRFFLQVEPDPGEYKQPADLSGSQWLGNLTLTEAWAAGHVLGRVPRYLEGTGHAWTLAYEEQFYAICGLLLIASRRRMNRFFAGTAAVSLVTFLVMISPPLRERTGGLFLQGNWIIFACGIAVYYDRMYAGRADRFVVRGLLVGLLALGLATASWTLIIGPAFALILIGLQRWDPVWSRARSPRFPWWCGVRCYSLYLVHWPIVRPLTRVLYEAGVRSIWGTLLITVPICLGISLAGAWAFHAAVERRFLNRADRPRVTVDTRALELLQVASTKA